VDSDGSDKIRLSKLMTQKGLCSRREADELISQGLVYVNGVIIDQLGTKVSPDSRITLATQALEQQKKLATFILNKPVGYVSSQPEKGYSPAVELITAENQFMSSRDHKPKLNFRKLQNSDFEGLATAGRLDIDSQGLLILTQDGRLAKKIIGENSEIEKEYLVRVVGRLSKQDLEKLRYGLELDGQKLKPAKVEWLNQDQLQFIHNEGKKRQIRRMCEAVGLQVRGLKRVRVGQLKLNDLPEGLWRFLEPGEKI
jgi:23S rRNA pseudouridine2604 synthase